MAKFEDLNLDLDLKEKIGEIFRKINQMSSSSLVPPTWGQELEVPYVNDNEWLFNELNAHEDGSGPIEFTYGPQTINNSLQVTFLSLLIAKGLVYVKPEEQMGNHLHIRPIIFRNAMLVSTAFLLPLLPFFASHLTEENNKIIYNFRRSVLNWTDRFGEIANYIYLIYKKKFGFFAHNYQGRQYSAFTLNRHNKNILTLEYRVNETLPLKTFAVAELLSLLFKKTDITFKSETTSSDIEDEIWRVRDEYVSAVEAGVSLDDEFRIPRIFKVFFDGKQIEKLTPAMLAKILFSHSRHPYSLTISTLMLRNKLQPYDNESMMMTVKENNIVKEQMKKDLFQIRSLFK